MPELTKIIRQKRRMGWIGPLMFGLFTAVGIFLIFDRPEDPRFGVFYTITFLGLAVWFPISVRRRRSRIQDLIAQFPEELSGWQ